MNMNKKTLVTAIAVSMGLSVVASSAQAATLTSLVITSGTYQMGPFTPVPNPITYFSGANLIAGAIAPTFDTTVSHGSAQASSPIAFDFNGGGTYMNHFTPVAAFGDETGGVMSGTIDLGINWNAASVLQLNDAFSGTGDGSNFSITWTARMIGGFNNGGINTYTVSGTYAVAAVPIPAAAWLMGSGLAGLVGVARRRRIRV